MDLQNRTYHHQPQGVNIGTVEAGEVVNFCANNYLGLAKDKNLIAAATEALQEYGFGLASVRFICQDA